MDEIGTGRRHEMADREEASEPSLANVVSFETNSQPVGKRANSLRRFDVNSKLFEASFHIFEQQSRSRASWRNRSASLDARARKLLLSVRAPATSPPGGDLWSAASFGVSTCSSMLCGTDAARGYISRQRAVLYPSFEAFQITVSYSLLNLTARHTRARAREMPSNFGTWLRTRPYSCPSTITRFTSRAACRMPTIA